jgi:predicted naringenin-chalcone synthase
MEPDYSTERARVHTSEVTHLRAHGESERAGGARIEGLAVTSSGTSYSQREVLELLDLQDDEFAQRIFARCGVEHRRLDLPGQALASSLQGRTSQVEDKLLERSLQAIEQLGVDPAQIATVISASLYSLGGPTLAHRLVESCEMDPSTDKYHITGVGCASAVPLMRLAQQSVREHPTKKALVIAAEGMSGLLTRSSGEDSRAKTVGSAIFGDGCAAAIIDGSPAASGPTILASMVHQIPGTLDSVRMELSDQDSYLHLNRDLPDVAAAGLPELLGEFLEPTGLTPFAIDHWIVHPGGRRILECVQEALSLNDSQVRIGYEVLANRGNVGTPSIFYVLDETIRQSEPQQGDLGLMLTIGPGISVGLMLLGW